jgi:hypothetical protein
VALNELLAVLFGTRSTLATGTVVDVPVYSMLAHAPPLVAYQKVLQPTKPNFAADAGEPLGVEAHRHGIARLQQVRPLGE